MSGQIDLVQVRTFVHLFETRSVTATAELMHVTQPTVSYTLGKLRRRFADELFVRTRDGLEPTPSATELYEPFSSALETLDRAAGPPAPFDPSRVTATQVGTGTFTFDSASSGTFTYTVNNVTSSRRIERMVF